MTTQLKYKNDPRDNYEVIIEETPADIFYNAEQEISEITENYIEYLEQKIKAMKKSIKVLHDEAEAMPSATYFKNKLLKIYKQ